MNEQQQHRYGMRHKHSPDAKGVACIDFDGTIVPWGPLFNPNAEAFPGAVETVNALAAEGWRIVILTSRLSRSWHRASGQKAAVQRKYVADTLKRLGVVYDKITAEKVPAEMYIDDRAIEYHDNWDEIAERILN